MQIIDCGTGAPIVLIPGIQGRWEYMRPAIDALAESSRVITYPLCGERGSRFGLTPTGGWDDFVDQIDAVLDDRHLARATICGVSFGGLIALRFAAQRPDRTSALILVSPPGPSFRLRRRHRIYVRLPRILGPVFLAEVPRRVGAEIALAIPDRSRRRRFAWRQLATLARAPVSLSRIAARARLIGVHDHQADCARILAPTLVVTGEPSLDHVVSAEGASEYLRLIPHACAVRLEQTGHLGYITRPSEFAATVREFLASNSLDQGGPSTGASRVSSRDGRVNASKNDAA